MKTRVLFVVAVIASILGLYGWACSLHTQVATMTQAVPDGSPGQGRYGLSMPGFTGCETLFGGADLRCENVDNYQLLGPGACANVDTTPLALTYGGTATYLGTAKFLTDNLLDASWNCDGGLCSYTIESKVPVDYHGGQLCLQGGSMCTNGDGGGLTWLTEEPPTPPSTAPVYGVSSQIVFNAAAMTLSTQACCGAASPCWVGGLISLMQDTVPPG